MNVMAFMQRLYRACLYLAAGTAALWPGLALAKGVKIECSQQASPGLHLLLIMGGVAGAIIALTLLAWAAHRVWRRYTGYYARFSFGLAAVVIAGLLLVISGIWLTPASSAVYASFGVELSAPVRLLMDYPFLLSLPLVLSPFLLMRAEGSAYREHYFAAFVAVEFALLCAAQWVLNIPIVIAC